MTSVVFDVGNVLIRWEPWLVFAEHLADRAEINAFFEEIGYAEWNLEQDRGRRWDDGIAMLCEAHPHRRALIEKLHTDWHKAVPSTIEGSVAILERLRATGVPLYAITNFSAEKWAECLERFPFLGRFDDAIVSAHERLIKPDPEIFDRFLRKTGCRAGDCVFIDDGQRNVAAARAAGMDAILFEGPEGLARDLRARGLPA
jgi:HAD superfamily hydrolase (TIGR01509 family)